MLTGLDIYVWWFYETPCIRTSGQRQYAIALQTLCNKLSIDSGSKSSEIINTWSGGRKTETIKYRSQRKTHKKMLS